MNWTQGANHPLVGRNVCIEWKDRRSVEWTMYTVIDYRDGWLLLRGRPDSDGCQFDGGDVFVPMKSIDMIELSDASER